MFRDSPVQLVEAHEGSLRLCAEGAEILSNFSTRSPGGEPVDRHVQVIAFAGSARAGKSSSINFLLKRFGVSIETKGCRFEAKAGGPTVTRGIVMWGRPLVLPNGDHLCLLDTQGAGLGDDSLNAQIVALAAVLSSLLVLNIDGVLAEDHKTLLSAVEGFVRKFPGTPEERQMLFAERLLVRSCNYEEKDFKTDFAPAVCRLVTIDSAESRTQLHTALDVKLESLMSERADAALEHATRGIRQAFPRRHVALPVSGGT